MRISSTLILAAGLAGCSAAADQPQAEPGAERIECALGGATAFAPDCLVERSEVEGDRVLVVRHPDGGLRRFEQVDDGRGLVVADGAEEAILNFADQVLEVSVSGDRYRFPASPNSTVKKAGASD